MICDRPLINDQMDFWGILDMHKITYVEYFEGNFLEYLINIIGEDEFIKIGYAEINKGR